MRRPRTSWQRVAGLLLIGALLGLGVLALRASLRLRHAPEVPSLVVAREPFLRQISAEGNLRAVAATPLSPPRSSGGPVKIAWTVPDGSLVKKGEVVVRFAPTDFEKQLEDARADSAKATTKTKKERALVAAALRLRERTEILSQTELEQRRRFPNADPEIFSRNQIIESGIDEELSLARTEHATAARQIEGELSVSKLDLIDIEQKKAGLSIKRAEDGLRSLTISAPHAGIVVFELDFRGNLFQSGDTVWMGQTIASMPLLDRMEAEVFILEADAGGLEVGKLGTLTLEAHPEKTYPVKVKRVDTLAKQRVRNSPSQYFGVTLELEATDPALMKPGSRVRASLILDQLSALVVPRQCVFERDGEFIVYRSQGGGFEATSVTLGAVSLGRVVVESGLEAGDRVALVDPSLDPRLDRGLELVAEPLAGDAK